MTASSAHISRSPSPHGTNALKTIRDIVFFEQRDTSSRSESDASRSRLEVSAPPKAKIFHWGASSKACSTFLEKKSIGYWNEDYTFTPPPHLIDLSHDSTSSSSECPRSSKTSAIDFSQDTDDTLSLSHECDVSMGLSDHEMSVDFEETSVKEPKQVRFALDPVTEIRYRPRTKYHELETFYVPRETWEWEYEVHLKCLLYNIPMVDAIPKREKRARIAYNPVMEVHHLPAEEQEETKISEDPSFEGMSILLEETLGDIFLSKKSDGLCGDLEALLELDLNDL
eukprot:scaffold41548_cov53-Attheya_sp.AAC.2